MAALALIGVAGLSAPFQTTTSTGLVRVVTTAVVTTLGLASLVAAARFCRTGLFLGPDGVKVVGLFKTHELSWDAVAEFTSRTRWYENGGAEIAVQARDGRLYSVVSFSVPYDVKTDVDRVLSSLEETRAALTAAG